MISRRFRQFRRFTIGQKVAALAPVLLLLIYLPGEMMLRCQMDGMLRPTCCCPHESESDNASPLIKAQDCCARETADTSRPAADAARPANRELVQMTAIAFAASAAPAIVPAAERADGSWQRYGPAREGPPIVLLKHAFLI